MIGTKRLRLLGTRKAGIGLVGLLAAGMALASGTAFASTSSSSASMSGMAGMSSSSSSARHGFTKGFYDGHTVRFYYSKNFRCMQAPASTAFSKCEGGTNYTQTPSSTFDPLYVIVPLGFTPAKWTLQCPAGRCIDHPRYIDLTSVLGSGTGNVLLPAHSHIVQTANHHQSEWWNVDIVGVKSLWAWNKLVHFKSARELQRLQRTDSAYVTGNIPTNLFLYFAVLKK
jgi:hypothetical protein